MSKVNDREVFVRLLDEGVDVWRPVQATSLGGDRFRLTAEPSADETESWEFTPGSIVETAWRTLSGSRVRVAISLGQPDAGTT